ncbi:MAG: arylsulfatase [Pirellulales bacterium]
MRIARFAWLLWLLSMVKLGFGGVASAADHGSDRLNVVFILADDLGWGELGCYGQQRVPTPNIDQLARQGMRFTQHYSGAPVCAPSRCVLMTGKHLGHAEIRGNLPASRHFPQFTEGQYPLTAAVRTFPQLFRESGYVPGAMGKWGLGPVGSTGDPNAKGFDLFFGYNCQSVAHSYYPSHLWRNGEHLKINEKPIPGHAKQPTGEVHLEDWISTSYAPDLMISEAEKFIAEHQKQPFLLYLPFIQPHVAMHPRPESVARFPLEWDTEVYRGENGYLPHPRPRAAYAAMIYELDSYVGRVMKSLDDAGLTDRTLVVFTSDNGTTHGSAANPKFHVGGADAKFFDSTAGLRGYKGSVYEGGLRVPMIARLPGRIAAGTVNDTPSYFADWFPTLCGSAGLDCPAGLDGESLWPILTGAESSLERRTPMLWVFAEYGGQVAVRLGNYKVLRRDLNQKSPADWEVYDLAADRGEQSNVAADHTELIDKACEILREQASENRIFPVNLTDLASRK